MLSMGVLPPESNCVAARIGMASSPNIAVAAFLMAILALASR
jgi:hypothetical protein